MTCTICGLAIDPVAAPTHPLCAEDDADAAMIRAAHAQWVRAGCPARGTSAQRALDAIRHAAMRHQFIDANLCRDALDRAGVPGPQRGPAFGRAVKEGWLEEVGRTASTGNRTNGHKVAQYRSLIREDRAA